MIYSQEYSLEVAMHLVVQQQDKERIEDLGVESYLVEMQDHYQR